jgi:chaperonin cofactor prefoldin
MQPSQPQDANERLEERVARLESVVEGLQDAVHRESRRFDALIDALQRKTQPAEIAKALGEDARRRGL